MTKETFARIKAALAVTSGAPVEDKVTRYITTTIKCCDSKMGYFC